MELIHGGSDSKESACDAGDLGSTPGLGRSPGEGNGNPLQYSCLENSMGRGVWQSTVHGPGKSLTLYRVVEKHQYSILLLLRHFSCVRLSATP